MPGTARAHRSVTNRPARASSETNGLGRAQLAEIQRARMLSAMFDVVCEHGAANVTVAHVVERSGVSRRTFYEVFEDLEDCFLAAFAQAVTYASERVLPAYRASGTWRERIRAALLALLCFLDEEPLIGRMLIVESLAAGPRSLERRRGVLAWIIAAVDAGHKETKTVSSASPPLMAEGVVGAVSAVLHRRLTEDQQGPPLLELLNPLMSMVAMPYLGSAAARRELTRTVPTADSHQPEDTLLSDPFKDAGMRLTYRTVRVLMAIAEQPQCSNRAIGKAAGVPDQGQISKLLGRLQRIGLVSNTGLGPGQGAPNAWSLTSKGQQVAHNIRTHTEDPTQPGGTA